MKTHGQNLPRSMDSRKLSAGTKALTIKNIIMGLLVALFLTAFAPPGASLAQEVKTVRVGFFAFDGYHMLDESGAPSGYGYELLQRLIGYTNWRYEYTGYEKSWNEMQDMLERGEIDLLTSAQMTPERLERFDFSKEPVGTSAAMLTADAGDCAYASGDYGNWDGIRIGMIEGNSRNGGLAAFAEANGFSYKPVYYASAVELVAALKSSDNIDAILTSNLRAAHGERVLAQFDPSPFYIIVRKGNTELLAEIDAALSKLISDAPGLRTRLMDKYYSPDSGVEIAFTAEERAYMKSMKDTVIRALICPDLAPYAYFENGEAKGIISDIARLMAERSGLNIEIVESRDRDESTNHIESGIPIWFDAWYNYPEAESKGYRITPPYYSMTVSRLYRKGQESFSKLALLTGTDPRMLGIDTAGFTETVYYDTCAEISEAILNGKQDLAYIYGKMAALAAYDDITNKLVTETVYSATLPLSVGVYENQNPLLYSIMNRVVGSITEKDLECAVDKNSRFEKLPFSLMGFIYDNPLIILLVMLLLLIAVVVSILLYVTSKRRRQTAAQLALEKQRAAELSDALRNAERASGAKSSFLSRVSHEMRTPLNAIIGFITLSKDAELERCREYLNDSEIAAKQLLAVINDVLDMSAIESGKMQLANKPFDFKQLIYSVTNLFVPQCAQKGIRFDTRLVTPLNDRLVGDALRLNQILINILGNAVKFTSRGSVSLAISKTTQSDDKAFIRFEISDTGCGMTDDMKSRLFKPFEQENAATAQKYGGSGLGLSIVKNLVSMMDGAIRVESEPDIGTTFTLDLPFGLTDDAEPERLGHSVDAMRVLAVDDEPVEREYFATVLTRIGVRFKCVDNGASALTEIESAASAGDMYNICIIDWKMPDMDGIELTRRIRDKYGKNVIVIIASAYEHYQADESARKAGADMFISKPLFQSSLFDLFMSLTGGKAGGIDSVAFVKRDLTGRRVLLAEDNVMNRIVAKGLTAKFGVMCDEAENGKIAFEKFVNSELGHYDAILMDIQMPEMDGYETAAAIRASSHPEAKTVQIIALTANAMNEDIARTMSAGMNSHVSKPIDPDALYDALSAAFRRNDSGTA